MADIKGKTPFVTADIVDGNATLRYSTGYNCSGTSHHEVLQHVRRPDGTEHAYVILRGVSRAKAQAIAMILNAPED